MGKTSKSAWKGMERRVAAKMGGQRIPCSGSGSIKGDVLHEVYCVECKMRAQISFKKWFEEVEKDTATMNRKNPKTVKKPLLVVKEKFQRGEFAIVRMDAFLELLGISTLADPSSGDVCAG